jgi:hypothetical protein
MDSSLPLRLDHHQGSTPIPFYMESMSTSFQIDDLEPTPSIATNKFQEDRVLVDDARVSINEYIHGVLNNHSDDLKDVTDDQVIESISLGLQQPKEWTIRHLLSNRSTLVKQIVASSAATAIAMGSFAVITEAIRTGGSIVLPQLDSLLTASQALYILTKTLGLDQMAIRRVNLLMEKHPSYLWLRTQKIKIPVPRFLRKYISEHQSERAYIEIMAEQLMDYMAMEGIRYLTIGNIYDYILSALLSGTVSYTWNQGTKLVRALRRMCSTDGFILMANSAASWGKKEEKEEGRGRDPLLLSSFVNNLDRNLAPDPLPVTVPVPSDIDESLADTLVSATTLGTTLMGGLIASQIAGGPVAVLTHIVQNDAVQQLVLNGMIERSGFKSLITGLGEVYTEKTLDKISATQREIWQSITPEKGGGVWTLNRKALIKQFFALVLGEQIYSDEMLEALDAAQLRAVIERQGIQIPVESNRWNKALLRQHIQESQKKVFKITYRELILNMSKHAMQSIATVAFIKGIHAFYASVNTSTVAKEIGLTPEEIAEINNPERGTLYREDVAGVTKVLEYMDQNPDVMAVLLEQEALTREDQVAMIQEKKDLFQAIRQEKLDRAALYKANQIQAYATKYGITQDQLANISRLDELQSLIEQQRTSIAEIVAGVKTQFGQVDPSRVIPMEMKQQWEDMQFVDLYSQIRNAVTEHLVDSTLIGPLSYANIIINSINYGKNTYNIGLAFSQLTGVYKEITDNLPYAPVTDLPLVGSAGQYLENMLIRPSKNVYQVFLEASLNQIKEANFDVRDLAWNVANRVIGKDSFMSDYHRLRYQNNLIAILLKHPEDARM